MNKTQFVSFLAVLAILALSLPALAQAPAHQVTVNGIAVTYDYARGAHVHENEVYIAAKALFAGLGRPWSCDPAANRLVTGGNAVTWDYSAFRGPHIHEDFLFVPVRPVADALGLKTNWDAAQRITQIMR